MLMRWSQITEPAKILWGFGVRPVFPVTPDENFRCHLFQSFRYVVLHSTRIQSNAGYIQIQQFLAHRIPFPPVHHTMRALYVYYSNNPLPSNIVSNRAYDVVPPSSLEPCLVAGHFRVGHVTGAGHTSADA